MLKNFHSSLLRNCRFTVLEKVLSHSVFSMSCHVMSKNITFMDNFAPMDWSSKKVSNMYTNYEMF